MNQHHQKNLRAFAFTVPRTYHGALIDMRRAGLPASTRFVRTGEVREVRPGEWYLSGAIPCSYHAPKGYSARMVIMRPVQGDM